MTVLLLGLGALAFVPILKPLPICPLCRRVVWLGCTLDGH